jgi:hypothetical protein
MHEEAAAPSNNSGLPDFGFDSGWDFFDSILDTAVKIDYASNASKFNYAPAVQDSVIYTPDTQTQTGYVPYTPIPQQRTGGETAAAMPMPANWWWVVAAAVVVVVVVSR